MTGEPLIDYEALTQNAMRSVVKEVLTRTANSGLPGDHHFYISFDTKAEGSAISKRLKGKYPNEMTIVLQHRFWDLNVYEDRFEVKLTFDGVPERLVVPYKAIKVFFDPSVRYGLQFEEPDFNSEAIDRTMSPVEISNLLKPIIEDGENDAQSGHSLRSSDSLAQHKTGTHNLRPLSRSEDNEANPSLEEQSKPEKAPVADKKDDETVSTNISNNSNDKSIDKGAKTVDSPTGAKIVSLDSFRKK